MTGQMRVGLLPSSLPQLRCHHRPYCFSHCSYKPARCYFWKRISGQLAFRIEEGRVRLGKLLLLGIRWQGYTRGLGTGSRCSAGWIWIEEPCPFQLEANKLAQSVLGLSELLPWLVQVALLLGQLLEPSHPQMGLPI